MKWGEKMFSKKNKQTDNIDYERLNEVIFISKKILKIIYFLAIVLGIYVGIKIFQELNLKQIVFIVLDTISPLFIGIFIAWLFDPIVKFLSRKRIRRGFGTVFVYLIFVSIVFLIIGTIIPVLSEQINELIKSLPSIFDTVKGWLTNIFDSLGDIDGVDIDDISDKTFGMIEQFGYDITANLPEMLMNFGKSLFSGIGTLCVGLIIGFYLLLNFDNANDLIISLFPKTMQKDTRELFNEVNTTFRKFIEGALLDSSLIFVVTSIAFLIIGLRAPLLFGLFCGITNVIPYVGPYIGGIPAVIVGFSEGPIIGLLTLISIGLIQFLEGNLLQPLIMSKSTKLHPVTIILGLLVFGHFFGIIGMAISTPVIGALKAIFQFFNEKYEFIKLDDIDD